MVLLEQFSQLSSAVDLIIPLLVVGGFLYDFRNRVIKKAKEKTETLESKIFDTKDPNSIISKLDDIDKRLDDVLIDVSRIKGQRGIE